MQALSAKALKLNIRDVERYVLEKVAKEMGFILPQDLGRLEVQDEKGLDRIEAWQIEKYIEGYSGLLESREKARLTMSMVNFGPPEAWAGRIFRASQIRRVLDETDNLAVDVPLPYLEGHRRFLVPFAMKPKEVLAQLLSHCEFSALRDALRNLNDIKIPRSPFEDKKHLEDPIIVAPGQGVETENNVLTEGENNTCLLDSKRSLADANRFKALPDEGLKSTDRVSGVSAGVSQQTLETEDQRQISQAQVNNAFDAVTGGSGIETVERGEEQRQGLVRSFQPSEVMRRIWAGMLDNRLAVHTQADNLTRRLGITPEQEEELRSNLKREIHAALEAGPIVYNKKLMGRSASGTRCPDFDAPEKSRDSRRTSAHLFGNIRTT